MYAKQTKVVNRSGLHARPASEFVLEAKKYESRITVRRLTAEEGEAVNAKSIVRLLAEGISQGTEIEIAADGADERQAVDSLAAILASGFGE